MVFVRKNLEELSHLLVLHFIEQAELCMKANGSFHVAFSGGSTPQLFYSLLAQEPYVSQIPWENIHFYQTDERFVPELHVDNNFNMISVRLFQHVPLNVKHLHRIQTEKITPLESAEQYEIALYSNLPQNNEGIPQFDFILLGVGVDGHIASLFPGTEALQLLDQLVISSYVEVLDSWRVSLSFLSLNSAKKIFVLVSGKNKAHIVAASHETRKKKIYPIQMLRPIEKLEWFFDNSVN